MSLKKVASTIPRLDYMALVQCERLIGSGRVPQNTIEWIQSVQLYASIDTAMPPSSQSFVSISIFRAWPWVDVIPYPRTISRLVRRDLAACACLRFRTDNEVPVLIGLKILVKFPRYLPKVLRGSLSFGKTPGLFEVKHLKRSATPLRGRKERTTRLLITLQPSNRGPKMISLASRSR